MGLDTVALLQSLLVVHPTHNAEVDAANFEGDPVDGDVGRSSVDRDGQSLSENRTSARATPTPKKIRLGVRKLEKFRRGSIPEVNFF